MDDAVSVTDVQVNPRRYLEQARVAPVTVTEAGQASVVIVSEAEYARLKRRDREALAIEELSDADIAAIAEARVPAEHRYRSDDPG